MKLRAILYGLTFLLYACTGSDPGRHSKNETGSERNMDTDKEMLEAGSRYRSDPLNKAAAFDYVEGLIREKNYAAALKVMSEIAGNHPEDESFQALYIKIIKQGYFTLDPGMLNPGWLSIGVHTPELDSVLVKINALDSLDRYIKEHGPDTNTLVRRGLIYLYLDHPEAAEYDFTGAFRLDQACFNSFYYVIYSIYLQGKHMQALSFLAQHYENINYMDDNNRQTILNMKHVLDDLAIIENSHTIDQKTKYLDKAKVYVKLKDYRLAMNCLDSAIISDQQYGDAYALRALVYYSLNMKAEALSDLEKAEKITGNVNSSLSRILRNQE